MKLNKHIKNNEPTDDLSYLSAVAFEQFNVTDEEIEGLNKKIDSKLNFNSNSFYIVFISGLVGLFIGISIFFVIFHKNKNHTDISTPILDSKTNLTLNNIISKTDTVFPETQKQELVTEKEHYTNSITKETEIQITEIPELLLPKTTELTQISNTENTDIILEFIPNAPTVFIYNLKVTNYKLYYFKQSNAVDININAGLSAQYESNKDVDKTSLSKSNSYLAHKIIQNAMYLFSTKKTTNCIEELTLLYNYNTNDANAQFYLGMCYFQLGKYNYALNYFIKNSDNENNIFHQESEYYKAMCYFYLNETEKAKQQLNSIIKNKGFYSKRAQESLKKVNTSLL